MGKQGSYDDRRYLYFNFEHPDQKLASHIMVASGYIQSRFVAKLICEFCNETGITADTPDEEIKNIIRSYTSNSLPAANLPCSTVTSNLGNQILGGLNELLKTLNVSFSSPSPQKEMKAAVTDISDGVQFEHRQNKEIERMIPASDDTDTIPFENSSAHDIDEIPIESEDDILQEDSFDESLEDIDLTAGKNALNAWNLKL